MRIYKSFKSFPLFILCLLNMAYTYAQTGLSRATDLELGSLYPSAIFTNTQDNSPAFGSFNGPYPSGVFYKFNLAATTVVSISPVHLLQIPI